MTNVTVQEALKVSIDYLSKLIEVVPSTTMASIIKQQQAALAEIEKCEPVAYMYEYPSKVEGWTTRTLSVSLEPDLHHLVKVTPLFTSPQPRDWAELTNADLKDLALNTTNPDEWAKAIGAKLKQLNTRG